MLSCVAGLRERKKERTRESIAGAARRLFGERGFERVTVAEVARAADVSEQTVFNYFRTKEDLFFQPLGAFEEEMLATVRERPPGEPAIAAFRRFLLSRPGLLGRGDPEAREQLVAVNRTIAESPALRRREAEILAGYTESLADLLGRRRPGARGRHRDDGRAPRADRLHAAPRARGRARTAPAARRPRAGRQGLRPCSSGG